MTQPLIPPPGSPIVLSEISTRDHPEIESKKKAEQELDDTLADLQDLSYRLYAENKRSILIVLQGMDTAGKDGTIRHVMRGVNPQMCHVTSFKQPSIEELDHDFLWRIHKAVPRKGEIGIFNRSHYEDVLIVRVHNLVEEKIWRARYDMINAFEEILAQGGTTILKFFLHISKEEQLQRLQARLDDPHKRWKFNKGDLDERKKWDDYQRAYEEALTRCNTEIAPWHIIPADRKWYRNLLIRRRLLAALSALDPQFPPAEKDLPKKLTDDM